MYFLWYFSYFKIQNINFKLLIYINYTLYIYIVCWANSLLFINNFSLNNNNGGIGKLLFIIS